MPQSEHSFNQGAAHDWIPLLQEKNNCCIFNYFLLSFYHVKNHSTFNYSIV